MNYLAHLHLGGDRPQQLLGSLYGDFVKGPLRNQWPQELERAIRLHRQIDAYTDSDPVFRQARQRFSPARRRVAGIMLDVFFDHCLACEWDRYAEQDLDEFSQRVYRLLERQPQLPGRLAHLAPLMIEQDWLGSYREFEVLQSVLNHLAQRLSVPALLAGAWEELGVHYAALREDFRRGYPQLQSFALRCQQTDQGEVNSIRSIQGCNR